MPEFVNGLPTHVMVIHFLVVLMPLAVLGAVVVALWPAARRRYGWLVVAVAAVATALVPIATDSGESLKNRLPPNSQIDEHERLGNQLLWYAIPLLVAVVALMVVHTMGQRQALRWARLATVAAAVLTLGLAVAAGIHVYRVGDAGSRAVWDYVEDLPPR
ncbi:MAG TPA: DUF2231 domain-containing protein [Actinophytocola sp.]|uniref:DUF2231 domain-containing protein n=1 Tax=Actinophytocola sp. TaxID=1872138 RepID=UPI002DDD5EDC|nr:DUF2231 domain-containing protein [Actinophytocola sp.]HEV2780218.1 DUF2231 domain-containing protein [Actinophytocola sp.]